MTKWDLFGSSEISQQRIVRLYESLTAEIGTLLIAKMLPSLHERFDEIFSQAGQLADLTTRYIKLPLSSDSLEKQTMASPP